MVTWMRVHEITTRQEWEATQPKPEPTADTFYERWSASNQRLRDWLQANSIHVERKGDQ
jgi:hypothetical protein